MKYRLVNICEDFNRNIWADKIYSTLLLIPCQSFAYVYLLTLFFSARGLRHCDPLSPFLFNLVEDALSQGINKEVSKGLTKGFSIRSTKRKGWGGGGASVCLAFTKLRSFSLIIAEQP